MVRGRTRQKPHTQIGQKGKGGGKPKPGGKPVPPFQTGGLPFQAGQMPKPAPTMPGFLPSTPSFERGMTSINDQRSLLENRFGNQVGMIQPNLNLQMSRLDTDQGQAMDRLHESLAERGVFTAGFRPKLEQQQVVTPFGRQRQDLASNAAAQYSDLASQYGLDLASLGGQEFNLYNDTAQETAAYPELGFDLSGYSVPNQPGPYFSTPRPGAGRTRPKSGGNKGGGNKGGNRGGRRGR